MTQTQQLPTSRIIPGNNDRKVFDQNELEDLATSIREHGLAQPITVRPLPDGCFQIVAGERRFRAISQVLAWPAIECIVRELDDEQASAIMLVENTSRADLTPIEEANAYQERLNRFSWTLERAAQVAGVSMDRVKRRLSLLRLAPDIQHLAAHGNLPLGHAEAMTVLDHNRQRIAIRIYQESKALPLSQFKHIVGELLAEQSQESLFGLESFWVTQVQRQAELPKRGKHAFTGAPTRTDLPPVKAGGNDSAAVVIDRWIASLIAQGKGSEAAVAGTLYDALVRMNYMSVPDNAALCHQTGANEQAPLFSL